MGSFWKYPFQVGLWVTALMSGAFSIFRELYGMYSGTLPPRSLFWSCTWIAFVFSAAILWMIEHQDKNKIERKLLARLEEKKPRLQLNLESALNTYDKKENCTVFILSAYLVNSGAATIAAGWTAKYLVDDCVEQMTGLYLRGSYSITVGDETLTLVNENLLQAQILTRQLVRGDARAGRLIFTVPGDRKAQIDACHFKIVVECRDFEGAPVTATFAPDTKPLPSIQMYPGEQLRKGVTQPEALSYTQPQLPKKGTK